MPMALKQDVVSARSRQYMPRPIDLVHLAGQTMGDTALENEVLSMFRIQSGIYIKMILNACDATDRISAAHSLKGAARGIGAFDLAHLAGEAEKLVHGDCAQLAGELDRVNAYIGELLDRR